MVIQGGVPNEPVNSLFRTLQIIGLAKLDSGRLIFRNPLYAELARLSPSLSTVEIAASATTLLVVLEDEAFNFLQNDKLREIAGSAQKGAVKSYNEGVYRLALVGFGSALEAMILDWLTSLDATKLAKSKTRATGLNFNQYENANDPMTWRLVNLVKVAQSVPSSTGPHIEVPDSLREFRNQVHPAVAVQNYRPERELEPEARIASGLFSQIFRDLAVELA